MSTKTNTKTSKRYDVYNSNTNELIRALVKKETIMQQMGCTDWIETLEALFEDGYRIVECRKILKADFNPA